MRHLHEDAEGPQSVQQDVHEPLFEPTKEQLEKFNIDIAEARLALYLADQHVYNLGSRLDTKLAAPIKGNENVRGYTNGCTISLTPVWLDATPEEQVCTLAHEIGHVMLKHIARAAAAAADVDWNKLNIAADLALIPFQQRMGQTPLITTFYNNWQDYEDMSMEDIYVKLVKDDKPDNGYDPGHLSPEDLSGDSQPTDQDVADTDSAIEQAAMAAAQGGFSTSASIATGRAIALQRVKKIPWDKYLDQTVSKIKTAGTTFSRPNRRLRSLGIIMPGRKKAKEFVVCQAVDVSGSVGEVALGKFMGTSHELLTKYASEMHLITFDDKIVDEWHLTPKDKIIDLKMNGYGGTYVEVVYKHLKDMDSQHKLLVIATDGGLRVPPNPGYPVVWLITDNPKFTSPYGTVIHIDTDKV